MSEIKIIKISGMHCKSCEILIERKFLDIPGIKKVQVNYHKGFAKIYSDENIDDGLIQSIVEESGYKIGEDIERTAISKNPADWRDLIASVIIFVLLFFVLRRFGFLNLGSSISRNSSNLFAVLLIGITAGFSTCMALVGGLILGISARYSEKHPSATSIQKFRPHLFFNLGRIISFFVLGGLIAMIGKVIQLSPLYLGLLTIFVGIVMLFLGLQLTEIFPKFSDYKLTLPKSLSHFLKINKKQEKEYSHSNSFLLGALTFFLPCGFTQAMQLLAISSGRFWSGALIMGLFVLGTTPGLLGIGGLTSFIKGIFARRFFKFVGVFVAALAIINISNGLNLTGFNPKILFSSSQKETNISDPNVKIVKGVQIIKMDQLSNQYSPNHFTIKQNIPSKWEINSLASNSCSSSIISPKLGIRKFLQPGENIIDFTPKETGTIQFSCAMGMYTGYFNIIPNKSNDKKKNEVKNISSKTSNQDLDFANAKILNATYSINQDIEPKEFTAKINQPTILKINVLDDGYGCMSSIVIPGLNDEIEYLQKGQNLEIKFKADHTGEYKIACGMGTARGYIYIRS